jgi:hypothetical protein
VYVHKKAGGAREERMCVFRLSSSHSLGANGRLPRPRRAGISRGLSSVPVANDRLPRQHRAGISRVPGANERPPHQPGLLPRR